LSLPNGTTIAARLNTDPDQLTIEGLARKAEKDDYNNIISTTYIKSS
jgi:hypothetical protein